MRNQLNIMISNNELIKKAKEVAKVHKGAKFVKTGEVGSALVTDKNNVYVGVSIDATSGVGFCGEHSAIASMTTNQEFVIKKIVAANAGGKILPPCGRCREMIYLMSKKNKETEVILSKNKTMKLKELLPHVWQEKL